MAKDVDKVKTKAKMNWGWNVPEDRDGKATRTTKSGKTTKTSTGKTSAGKTTTRKTTSTSKSRTQKSVEKKVEKKIRKSIGWKGVLIVLIVMIIGIGAGVGAFYYVGRNDCFELIGEDYVVLELGQSYVDEGVKVISLGKDISNEVIIETDGLIDNGDGSFTATTADRYVMIYKTKDIKYGKIFTVQRIRFIDFVDPIEPDRTEPEETTAQINFNLNKGELV